MRTKAQETVKAMRRKLGLTQEQFAKALGVTLRAASGYETGSLRPPGERAIRNLYLFAVENKQDDFARAFMAAHTGLLAGKLITPSLASKTDSPFTLGAM